jgi:hypothetical protein
MKNIFAFLKKLDRDTLVRTGLWTFFSLVVIFGIKSCSSGSGGAVGNGIWILLFAGLIVAAVMSKDRPYLALTFSGLAVLVFLILIGKLDTLFVWEVLGLPLFAAAGVLGWIKTDNRTRSFLGFASGTIILIWLSLIARRFVSIDLTFLGDRYSTSELFLMGLTAVIVAVISTWKRSAILFIAFLFIAACWLGADFFTAMAKRSPISNPIPVSIQNGAKAIIEGVGKGMEHLGEKMKNPKEISIPGSGKATDQKIIRLVYSDELKKGEVHSVYFTPGKYTTPNNISIIRGGEFESVANATFVVANGDQPLIKVRAEKEENVRIYEIE